jgi:uncharacterized protein (UPF0548 family)
VPRDASVGENETVILLLRAAGLWAPAPCRVIYVVDQADQFGFAYGTLPGHPETGEVAFMVARTVPRGSIFASHRSLAASIHWLAWPRQ